MRTGLLAGWHRVRENFSSIVQCGDPGGDTPAKACGHGLRRMNVHAKRCNKSNQPELGKCALDGVCYGRVHHHHHHIVLTST